MSLIGISIILGLLGIGGMYGGFKYHTRHGIVSTIFAGSSFPFYILGVRNFIKIIPEMPHLPLEYFPHFSISIPFFVGVVLLIVSGVASNLYQRKQEKGD